MSMQLLTCLQILWVFTAYMTAVVLLPWFLLHRKLAAYPVEERLMCYFLSGSFYLTGLVLLLQLLHISNTVTLSAGTILPFLLSARKHPEKLTAGMEKARARLYQLAKRERTIKTELFRMFRRIRKKAVEKMPWIRKHLPEILCFLLFVPALFYEYGTNLIRLYGYKASDVIVHNYWINLMNQNRIFSAGVYPHGFHCVIYYMEKIFRIPVYVSLRVFPLTQVFLIHLALLLPLRRLCRNRYLPYAGLLGYILLPVFRPESYQRFLAALPQEYSMIFMIPAGYFAIRFLESCIRKEKKTQESIPGRFYLVCFGLSFSLSFSAHFYGTMIAGLFCLAAAITYRKTLIRSRVSRKIITAGILSLMLAAAPMAAGMLEGNELQGSLLWGLDVMGGDNTGGETGEQKESLTPEVLAGKIQEKIVQLQGKVQGDAVGLDSMTGKAAADIMISGSFALFALGWIEYSANRKKRRYAVLWTAGWLDLFMLLMLEAPVLHLPRLMDENRTAVFFNYIQAFVFPILFDGIFELCFPAWRKKRKYGEAGTFAALVLSVFLMVFFHLERPVCAGNMYESNQAVACTTDIIRTNQNFTWTVCSANDEAQMVSPYGYHEDMITFLRKVESGKKSVTIPTKYVYFYIEKVPVDYDGSVSAEGGCIPVSEKGASEPLNRNDEVSSYTGKNRWITMSHMYIWAEKFRKLYPDEMEIYYEDENFVCYRLAQNTEYLYNFAE